MNHDMKTGAADNDPTPKLPLAIVPAGKKALTQEQRRFNNLAARIVKLEKSIEEESARLDRLYALHSTEVAPLEEKNAALMMDVAGALDEFSKSTRLGKRQLESVRTMIVDLCGRSFHVLEPSEAMIALYDRWAETSYDDELRRQTEEMKSDMEDMLSHEMGIDVDLSDLDDSPESFARLQEQFEQLKEKKERTNARTKKSKKQKAEEAKRQAKEELKGKSLRGIYIALAKVLHPDTETDEELKKQREEVMKQVTQAYADKDLHALLRLEMEWVHRESMHADRLTAEQLAIYCSALEEQADELMQQKEMLAMQPRYHAIAHLAGMPERKAIGRVRSEAANVRQAIVDFTGFNTFIASSPSHQDIFRRIDGYIEAYVSEPDPFEELDELLDLMEFGDPFDTKPRGRSRRSGSRHA